MSRTGLLPFLPGVPLLNKKIGCELFPKSVGLDFINGEIRYVREKISSQSSIIEPFIYDPVPRRYPSLFPCKEHPELPSFVIYDKKILSFDAYFYGKSWETHADIQRKVKINYFLEDGTIQVNEKRIPNSGISQGTLISRRRIPFPEPAHKAFYEMTDLNIGCSVNFFGKIFLIVNCDHFTRTFLNRAGISVSDPIDFPSDSFLVEEQKKKERCLGKKVSMRPKQQLDQFIKFDRKILRFFGYWDDRVNEGGRLYKITLYYYLADDTISIRHDDGILLSRCQLPKDPTTLRKPGDLELKSYLNVFPTGFLKGRVAADPLNVGYEERPCYRDKDLTIGAYINAYGRPIMLTGCDPFTKEFYRVKYGIDTFPELIVEGDTHKEEKKETKIITRELPPWNGYGTFEDSEMNCKSFILKTPRIDGVQLFAKSRMLSREKINQGRRFIISFYLSDNTTSVFENAAANSGFLTKMFIGRKEAFKPVRSMYVSQKPPVYTKEDFWVGNVLEIDSYQFELLEADEYALRYMEINAQEFPKSNIVLIMKKIKEKIKPIFKSFVREHFSCEQMTFEHLAAALRTLLADEITPHEILTVARHFAVGVVQEKYTKDCLKKICRNECRRHLFQNYDRLAETLKSFDDYDTGYLQKSLAYSVCRGARIPIQPELLKTVLDRTNKNAKGDVELTDLLQFFDGSWTVATSPFHHVREFSDFPRLTDKPKMQGLDVRKFLNFLDLESTLKDV